MKETSQILIKHKYLVIGASLFIGLTIVYFIVFKDKKEGSLLISQEDSVEISTMREELVQLLRDLSRIKLDGSLFEDAMFKSLIDFSVELSPLPVGRRNPFLPLEESGGRTTSTSTL